MANISASGFADSGSDIEAAALVGSAGASRPMPTTGRLRPIFVAPTVGLGLVLLIAGTALAFTGVGNASEVRAATAPATAVDELIVATAALEQATGSLAAEQYAAPPEPPCSAGCRRRLEDTLSKCKPGSLGCHKPAHHRHARCLMQCACSDKCQGDLHSALTLCRPGDMGCKKPAHHRHKHCHEACLGSTH